MLFYTVQVLMCLYAYCSAQQEESVVEYQRNSIPIGAGAVDQHHFWGAAMTAIFCVVSSIPQDTIAGILLAPLVCAAWYWIVFDASLNLLTIEGKSFWQRVFYIGQTAKIDRFLFSGFEVKVGKVRLRWTGWGKYAGKRKLLLCIAGILLLNVGYYFL